MNTCTKCGARFFWSPIIENNKPFCDKVCVETYQKEKDETLTKDELEKDFHFV